MMSLRLRLILAFLLLSVVPLSAVTFYSYSSNVRAFQQAVEVESRQSAAEMSRRMEDITAALGRRVDRFLATVEDVDETPGEEAPHRKAMAELAPLLGDAAELLERIEFHPVGETGHAAPRSGATSGRARADLEPPAPASRSSRTRTPPAPPAPAAGPVPPVPPRAIVIDMASVLEYTRKAARGQGSEANAAAVEDLIRKGVELGVAGADFGVRAAAKLAREAAARSDVKHDGRALEIAVKRQGKLLGKANAMLNLDRTLQTVLAQSRREQGEIAFAIDERGKLYTAGAGPEEGGTLRTLGVAQAAAGGVRRAGDWVVVTRRDPSGLTFGIARPVGGSLRAIRRASVRNLSLGLLVIGLAIVGIVPISGRMTRNLSTLTAGVRRLAAGDFQTRVPVRSSDEFGQLAQAFNQMAQDLERHQRLAVDRERLQRELELSRLIQTEMLPHAPLRLGATEVKGVSIPAREVGGDFFNYFMLADGTLALLVGDVSGKGVSAALLMANAQATLRARLPGEPDLARLAQALDQEFEDNTPRGVFLTLFMGVLDPARGVLRYVNAGHQPQFVLGAAGGLERLSSTGLPLGLFAGHGYTEVSVKVSPGDLLFFYTDGLVEAENERGEEFGAERLEAILTKEHAGAIDTVLAHTEQAVRTFRGAAEPLDDATMMVLRLG
jgi:serine phosphatase RsbU (regulator of sigma subunit)